MNNNFDIFINKIDELSNKYTNDNDNNKPNNLEIDDYIKLMFKMEEKYNNKSQLCNEINKILLSLALEPNKNINMMFENIRNIIKEKDKNAIELIDQYLQNPKLNAYSIVNLNKLKNIINQF